MKSATVFDFACPCNKNTGKLCAVLRGLVWFTVCSVEFNAARRVPQALADMKAQAAGKGPLGKGTGIKYSK